MKVSSYSERSFFAKMVLLFALVFLGHPAKRQGLENYLKSFFKADTVTVGQVPGSNLMATPQVKPSLPR